MSEGGPVPSVYDDVNDVAMGVLNGVIWALWQGGQEQAAKLITQERDQEAMRTYDQKLSARDARYEIYKAVELTHTDETHAIHFQEPTVLGRVYEIIVKYEQTINKIEDVSDLYTRVLRIYFQNLFTDDHKLDTMSAKAFLNDIDVIYKIRKHTDQVGRCLRHIKNDKPTLFHPDLNDGSASDCAKNTGDFGNTAVGVDK